MAGTDWALMPSVLIVEILSYISLTDRLKVSSVCKRWRSCLFHPTLWSRITFDVGLKKREKSKFLSSVCGRFIKECVVKFNSHDVDSVKECLKLMRILAQNKNLQVFCLEPSGCHMEWPENGSCTRYVRLRDLVILREKWLKYLQTVETLIRRHRYKHYNILTYTELMQYFKLLKYIEDIIENSRKLRHISLGCVEEVLEHSSSILNKLLSRHSSSLEGLYLADVKEDSENYGIIELETHKLHKFQNLKHLSIDYDFLDNQVLQAFVEGGQRQLKSLIIHVHGIDPEHEKVTNETWGRLKRHCKDLVVTLNLVHSYIGVHSLLDILHPNLPLAHYRQFFCSKINTPAISLIARHYGETLKSVHIIDGCPHPDQPSSYEVNTQEDPFVMLAWKCPNLESFTLIGYEMDDDDITAIARLRGKNLKSLNIPFKCITSYYLVSNDEYIDYIYGEFSEKISTSLNFTWKPLDDNEIPAAVYDDTADAELAYMDILLEDQRHK